MPQESTGAIRRYLCHKKVLVPQEGTCATRPCHAHVHVHVKNMPQEHVSMVATLQVSEYPSEGRPVFDKSMTDHPLAWTGLTHHVERSLDHHVGWRAWMGRVPHIDAEASPQTCTPVLSKRIINNSCHSCSGHDAVRPTSAP